MPTILNEVISNRDVFSVSVNETGVAVGTYDIVVHHSIFNITQGFSLLIPTLTNATIKLYVQNKSGGEMELTPSLFNVTTLDSSEPWITDISLPVRALIIRVISTGGADIEFDMFSPKS